MEQDKKLKNFIKTTLREFLNENANLKLEDNINTIIDKFTTKYGEKLATHQHIRRIENDILWKLEQDIDKYLMFHYGNDTSYRKILSVIDKFTKGGALFDDNNTILSEKILKELGMEIF